MKPSHYDQQAPGFDQRTGIRQPQKVATAIAQLCSPSQSTTLVEIGCGTGQIGVLLAQQFSNYIGIDLSVGMLQQFSPRLDHTQHHTLIQADGNHTWPIADNLANVVFSSRAIHWLDIEHTVNEVYRVSMNKEALFIVGRVGRAADCWASKLRLKCHQLLLQRKLHPRNGDTHLIKLTEAFSQHKAQILAPVVVNRWQQKRSLQQALHDWADKPGLAGIDVDNTVKQQILNELKQWASATFGDRLPTESERQYVLYPIKLNTNQ